MPSNPSSWSRRMFPTAHRLILETKITEHFPRLTGSVLVLGAGHDPYSSLLSGTSIVLTTDISDERGAIDRIADAHDLPFDGGSFDCVAAIEVFEHLVSPSKAANELLRVLKPGGNAVVSAPFMFHVHGDPYDFSFLTKRGFEHLFSDASAIATTEIGGRLHVLSDFVTTTIRPFAALRIINHLFRLPCLRSQISNDCPSGYWAEVTK